MATKPLNQPRQPLDVDFDEADLFPQETDPSPPPEEMTAERSGPAWRILFHVSGAQARTIGLDIWRVTVLGRADPMSAFRPDIDFAPHGAMRHGVSRRHALIRPGEHTLYLIDQNSTNGTWINGHRLLSGRDFPLTDGDVLELGALRMQLRIVQSPQGENDQPSAHLPPDDSRPPDKDSSKPRRRRRRFGWPGSH